MPTGSPKPQTIASEKYQKKAGWMTKGFKDKRTYESIHRRSK